MFENLPQKVTIIEVGPRDGLQFEKKIAPIDFKVRLIKDLVNAGLRHIQIASFVNPALVPQMCDVETLIKRLDNSEAVFSALVLNKKGVERAFNSGIKHIEISVSASDTHSRKNAHVSLRQGIENGKDMILTSIGRGLKVRAGIQCAFGCAYEGSVPMERIVDIAEDFIRARAHSLAISDTTGMAHPLAVKEMIEAIKPKALNVPIILHLHNTRGLGLVNLMTALNCGVTIFDTSVGGMGGCPFVPGAAGNIATEDAAFLMKTFNIETGIDIPMVSRCALRLEKFFNKRFSGRRTVQASIKGE